MRIGVGERLRSAGLDPVAGLGPQAKQRAKANKAPGASLEPCHPCELSTPREPLDRAALHHSGDHRRALARAGHQRSIQGRPLDGGKRGLDALTVVITHGETETSGSACPESKFGAVRHVVLFVEVDAERIESPISSGTQRNQSSVLELYRSTTHGGKERRDAPFVLLCCVLHEPQTRRARRVDHPGIHLDCSEPRISDQPLNARLCRMLFSR